MFLINPYILQASGNPLWDGLQAYYTADNTGNDALGTYNGTLTNGATYGTGIINNGFSLDGVNDYVDIGNNLDFDGTTPFSFNFWLNTSTSSFRYLISKRLSSGSFIGYSIMINADDTIEFQIVNDVVSDNRIRVNSINTYTTNSLSMITVTYDGSQDSSGINIYINNVASSINTRSNNLSLSTSNVASLNFGVLGSSNYYDGIIDEVAVFEKELSASEVTELYNSGAGKQYPN